MTTDAKKYTAAWLYGTLLLGAAAGAMIYYFASPKEPCPVCPEPPDVKWLAAFDAKQIGAMISVADAWGVRYYLAHNGSSFSVLAGPITEDGAHAKEASGELLFRMFKGFRGTETDMTLLNEAAAEAAVKAAASHGRAPWSIDVKTEILNRLLGVSGANGLGIVERNTTDGVASFELVPVAIAADAARAVGSTSDILMGAAPCPVHCPREPAYYLHRR